MAYDPAYFDPAFFDTAFVGPPPSQGPGSPTVSPYFDGCYFDPTYFDASECVTPPATTGGGRLPATGEGLFRRRRLANDVGPLDDEEAIFILEAT